MKKAVGRMASFLLVCALLLCLTGCGRLTRYSRTFYDYFDTVTVITGYAGSEREFDAVCTAAEAVLAKVHRLADIYHEYGGMNNLCTINRNAGIAPVQTDSELIELIAFSLELGEASDGALNGAMGAVLALWHTARDEALNGGEAAVPDDEALAEAALHCDPADVILDREAGTVFLRDAKMSLDLGAAAKGFACEKAAEAALAAGGEGYVLDAGGNIRVLGAKPDGSPWTAGVQDPFSDRAAYIEKLALDGGALATSGDYQRFYEVDGVKYHHIIDPATLYPAAGCSSVTVLAADAGLADALSTALFILPPEDGAALAERFGAQAIWVLPDGTVRMTDGVKNYLAE